MHSYTSRLATAVVMTLTFVACGDGNGTIATVTAPTPTPAPRSTFAVFGVVPCRCVICACDGAVKTTSAVASATVIPRMCRVCVMVSTPSSLFNSFFNSFTSFTSWLYRYSLNGNWHSCFRRKFRKRL